MNDYHLQVTMTAAQARIIIKALDLYTHMGIGHTEVVAEQIIELCDVAYDEQKKVRNYLMDLKTKVLGHPRNGSHAIASPKVLPIVKTAYDLEKAIQKGVAMAEDYIQHQDSVWHIGDILHLGTEPTPKIAYIRDGHVQPIEAGRAK